LVALPGKSTSLASMKMTPQKVSTAAAHTFTATALIYASILIRISLKTASVMSLILTGCESSGIASSMLILVKHSKKRTSFRGHNLLLIDLETTNL